MKASLDFKFLAAFEGFGRAAFVRVFFFVVLYYGLGGGVVDAKLFGDLRVDEVYIDDAPSFLDAFEQVRLGFFVDFAILFGCDSCCDIDWFYLIADELYGGWCLCGHQFLVSSSH